MLEVVSLFNIIYNTETGELKIGRQQYQGLKNIPALLLKSELSSIL